MDELLQFLIASMNFALEKVGHLDKGFNRISFNNHTFELS